MSTLSFLKGQNWKCQKCNTVLSLRYPSTKTEEEVYTLLLDTHKKAQIDCTAPAGFKLVDTFVKQEEIK